MPDTDAIEKLVNEYFKALPGGFPNHDVSQQQAKTPDYDALLNKGNIFNGKSPQANLPDSHFPGNSGMPQSVAGSGISPSAHEHGNGVNMSNPQTSLPDPHFKNNGGVPSSVAGSGISPSAIEHGKTLNPGNPQSSLPDLHYPNGGGIPKSVAGSGISPSAHEQGNAVNMSNPQTSLPDSHFKNNGGIPKSVAGSGISPSIMKKDSSLENISYISGESYDTELANVLVSILSFINILQMPGVPMPGASDASYYFLPKVPSFPFDKEFHPFPTKAYLDTKSNAGLIPPPFDANLIKKDFPILQERVHGRPLIWLDNAATTQKPKHVIDRISHFYEHENSNIHRAAHDLAARATDAYEDARKKVQLFLNASSPNEIVFVRGTTEAINLVAQSWGDQHLKADDEIILSHLEHHANIVPWQLLAEKKGLKLRVIPVDDDGQVILSEYAKLLGPKTKLVSFTQVSNALGTIMPAKIMVEMGHQSGAKVLVDGAQSVSHMRVDMRDLNCDWFVFSGHKIFGPSGIGVIYGKEDLLNETQPWQGGGSMIKDVTFERSTFQNAPSRFEAGTGNIADAVGLGAALDYVSRLGIDNINQYEHYLLLYATKLMQDVPGLTMIGTAPDKASVLSFVLEGYKTEEVGAALNEEGIAVRSGHHCAQPILRRFGLETTVRPSLAFYNTCSDVDMLVSTLWKLKGR